MASVAEQEQVLDLLAEGKINAKEAQQLLEKLQGTGESRRDAGPGNEPRRARPRQVKRLRFEIREAGGKVTSVCVPMMLVKTGQALEALLPEWVTRKVIVNGADLSELCKLRGDQFLDAVHDVEVQCGGDSVRMYCE